MADNNKKTNNFNMPLLAVAPMMDWTDRHCRYFHRRLSRSVELWTEMVTAPALTRGDPERLLAHDPEEAPLVLQLGGSDPEELHRAAGLAKGFGLTAINLNVGCPSDRVRSGAFGAVLMRDPELVRDCMAALADAVGRDQVSVKCRIGVDEQDPEVVLPHFIETVAGAGVSRFVIHARKAWLKGLSPKDNRTIPPLDYDLVLAMKARFPALWIGINGGIETLEAARGFLEAGCDGVMIGRAAYHDPGRILAPADAFLAGGAPPWSARSMVSAVEAMLPYIEREVANGTRLSAITRHMLGAFAGQPGARQWRRCLSEGAHRPGAGPELVREALGHVTVAAA